MPELVKHHLRESDALVLESNHDLEMLKVGPYPWHVKQRVMSRTGHLSNDTRQRSFWPIPKASTGGPRYLVLAHLSENNNNPDVARISAEEALGRRPASCLSRPVAGRLAARTAAADCVVAFPKAAGQNPIMKLSVQVLVLLLFAVATPSGIVWGQAKPPTRPAVAYAVDGVLYLATESGEVVKKIDVEYPIGDFAISPDLKTVVFVPPHPGEEGGPLFVMDVASEKIEPVMPDPYFNDDSVAGDFALFYSDPEFSPDGKRVVFATHAYGEGNEVQLSGPLALLDIETREVSIVGSTVASDGLPLGYIRYPHWSPDGKQILGTVEGHSFVTDAAGKDLTEIILPAGEVIQSADSYGMLAVGWFGSGCVLYKAGEDLGHDPARIFTISTEETSPASELLRLPEDSLRGLREFSGGLRLFVDDVGFRVEGPGMSWLIQGDSEISYAHLLPQRGGANGQIPPSCK